MGCTKLDDSFVGDIIYRKFACQACHLKICVCNIEYLASDHWNLRSINTTWIMHLFDECYGETCLAILAIIAYCRCWYFVCNFFNIHT